MKTIIVLCCFFAIAYSSPPAFRFGNFIPKAEIVTKAAEVSGSGYRSGSGSSTSHSCLIDCGKKYGQMVQANSEVSKHQELGSKAYRYADQFKPSVIDVQCNAYNSTMDCIRPCSDAAGKNAIKEALDIQGYKCVNSKFHTYAPCYFKVNNEMLSACNTKCATKKSNLERDMSRELTSVADVDAFIKHFCEYLDCDSDCDSNKITQECGADAAHVMQGYYKKNVDVLRAQLAEKGFALPSVCNHVGKHDDDE